MRAFSRLIFVVIMLCHAYVTASAQTAPKEAPETGTITGRVTTRDDEPLPNVGLALMPVQFNGQFKAVGRATTGADGFYRMTNVPAGSYRLHILAPAYTSASSSRGAAGTKQNYQPHGGRDD
jgi:hypothetical protein